MQATGCTLSSLVTRPSSSQTRPGMCPSAAAAVCKARPPTSLATLCQRRQHLERRLLHRCGRAALGQSQQGAHCASLQDGFMQVRLRLRPPCEQSQVPAAACSLVVGTANPACTAVVCTANACLCRELACIAGIHRLASIWLMVACGVMACEVRGGCDGDGWLCACSRVCH